MPGDEAAAQLRAAHESRRRGPRVCGSGARDAWSLRSDADAHRHDCGGRNDTDAADALSVLASDIEAADQIATRLVDRLADDATQSPARGRLTQALAAVPGTTASHALVELSHDEDRAVALTAAYLLQLRSAR